MSEPSFQFGLVDSETGEGHMDDYYRSADVGAVARKAWVVGYMVGVGVGLLLGAAIGTFITVIT